MSSVPGTPPRAGVRAALGAAAWPVVALGGLVAVEGLAVTGLGVLQVVRGLGSDIDDPVRAEIGAAIALLGGVCLLLVARALVFGQRWARSPVMVTQLLSLPVAVALIQNDLAGYGVPLAVLAVVVIVLLLVAGVYRPVDDEL